MIWLFEYESLVVIPVCAMSSEYFTRTSLYLVRLKIFEWIKFLRRHLHQIQGNWAGRNFVTASRVNSRLITHARMQRWIWNFQLPTDSTFEKEIHLWIWGVRLTTLLWSKKKLLLYHLILKENKNNRCTWGAWSYYKLPQKKAVKSTCKCILWLDNQVHLLV